VQIAVRLGHNSLAYTILQPFVSKSVTKSLSLVLPSAGSLFPETGFVSFVPHWLSAKTWVSSELLAVELQYATRLAGIDEYYGMEWDGNVQVAGSSSNPSSSGPASPVKDSQRKLSVRGGKDSKEISSTAGEKDSWMVRKQALSRVYSAVAVALHNGAADNGSTKLSEIFGFPEILSATRALSETKIAGSVSGAGTDVRLCDWQTQAINEGAVLFFNLCLPYLQPSRRPELSVPLRAFCKALKHVNSPLHVIRMLFHVELAKIESQEQYFSRAAEHAQRALELLPVDILSPPLDGSIRGVWFSSLRNSGFSNPAALIRSIARDLGALALRIRLQTSTPDRGMKSGSSGSLEDSIEWVSVLKSIATLHDQARASAGNAPLVKLFVEKSIQTINADHSYSLLEDLISKTLEFKFAGASSSSSGGGSILTSVKVLPTGKYAWDLAVTRIRNEVAANTLSRHLLIDSISVAMDHGLWDLAVEVSLFYLAQNWIPDALAALLGSDADHASGSEKSDGLAAASIAGLDSAREGSMSTLFIREKKSSTSSRPGSSKQFLSSSGSSLEAERSRIISEMHPIMIGDFEKERARVLLNASVCLYKIAERLARSLHQSHSVHATTNAAKTVLHSSGEISPGEFKAEKIRAQITSITNLTQDIVLSLISFGQKGGHEWMVVNAASCWWNFTRLEGSLSLGSNPTQAGLEKLRKILEAVKEIRSGNPNLFAKIVEAYAREAIRITEELQAAADAKERLAAAAPNGSTPAGAGAGGTSPGTAAGSGPEKSPKKGAKPSVVKQENLHLQELKIVEEFIQMALVNSEGSPLTKRGLLEAWCKLHKFKLGLSMGVSMATGAVPAASTAAGSEAALPGAAGGATSNASAAPASMAVATTSTTTLLPSISVVMGIVGDAISSAPDTEDKILLTVEALSMALKPSSKESEYETQQSILLKAVEWIEKCPEPSSGTWEELYHAELLVRLGQRAISLSLWNVSIRLCKSALNLEGLRTILRSWKSVEERASACLSNNLRTLTVRWAAAAKAVLGHAEAGIGGVLDATGMPLSYINYTDVTKLMLFVPEQESRRLSALKHMHDSLEMASALGDVELAMSSANKFFNSALGLVFQPGAARESIQGPLLSVISHLNKLPWILTAARSNPSSSLFGVSSFPSIEDCDILYSLCRGFLACALGS
jgi:hypothetical protein